MVSVDSLSGEMSPNIRNQRQASALDQEYRTLMISISPSADGAYPQAIAGQVRKSMAGREKRCDAYEILSPLAENVRKYHYLQVCNLHISEHISLL
jgi:hypothetical protein